MIFVYMFVIGLIALGIVCVICITSIYYVEWKKDVSYTIEEESVNVETDLTHHTNTKYNMEGIFDPIILAQSIEDWNVFHKGKKQC